MYYWHQSNKKQTEKSFEKVRIEVELKDILLNHFYKRDRLIMINLSCKFLGVWVGLAFLGYCVYFVRKRRKMKGKREVTKAASGPNLPDFRDRDAVKRFFIQELQRGKELLATGVIENGVEHLAFAVTVHPQPSTILDRFKDGLSPHIYQMLVHLVTQKDMLDIRESMMSSMVGGVDVDDDDDEDDDVE